jgi:TP901 family phage tail tape measure protein
MAATAVGTIRVDAVLNAAKFTTGVKAAMAQLGVFRGAVASAGAAVKSFGGMLGAGLSVYAIRSIIKSTEEFNQALRSSLAIMPNVSDEMKKSMITAAQQVAFSTKFSTKEAAEAYYFLASAGLDAAQSVKAMPAVSQFAQAGMFDLARATDLLTDAQSALGLTVKDASKNVENMVRVSDVLVKANTLANASVEQFSEALTNKAGAALRIVGKDIEEGVAVLATFADQGIKGAEAGTALGIVMRDLQTKGIQNAAAFAKVGVAVYDATGDMRNMADIIKDLEKALAGMSDREVKATILGLGFGDKSVAYLQSLIGTSDKIRGYEENLRKAGGTTMEIAGKQLPEFTKAMNKLMAAWDAFKIELIAPMLESVGAAISDMLGPMDKLGNKTRMLALQFRIMVTEFQEGQMLILKGFSLFMPNLSFADIDKQTGFVIAKRKQLEAELRAIGMVGYSGRNGGADAGPAGAAKSTLTDINDLLAQQRSKLQSVGDTIAKSLRTPVEIYRDTMKDLAGHAYLGTISGDIMRRGMLRAQKELRDAIKPPEYQGVAAIERGTQEAYSAENRNRYQQEANDRMRSMLAEIQRQTNIEQMILDFLRDLKPEEATI